MVDFEFLILANHAEVQNGLLYLSGAGWNDANLRFAADGASTPLHFGVAVSVLVPWTETNRRHRLEVWIEHEDGGDPLFRTEGDLEVGRPAGVQEGVDQRAVLALTVNLQFPKPGGYRVVAGLDGARTRSVPFRVRGFGDPPASPSQAAG